MILLDAIFINNSGGKILLDYLIESLEKEDLPIHYLLDKRTEQSFKNIPTHKKTFLEGSLIKRHFFYLKNKEKFSTVLCFGNIPPSIKISAKVYTYFHQMLFLDIPKNTPMFGKFIFSLKSSIVKFLTKNTNQFWVQSSLIGKKIEEKYKISSQNICILPFFPEFKPTKEIHKIKNRFCYVSNAPDHKNHKKLLEAFEKFYLSEKKGELIVTIDENFPQLLEKVKQMKVKGIPVHNLGFVPREKLLEVYYSSDFLIYPSLSESFGLAIAEAINCGCKVIGADLPYMHAACEPSFTFNPLEDESIVNAFYTAINQDLPISKSKIKNNISQIIEILRKS